MAGDFQRYQIRHRVARLIEPHFFESTASTYATTTLTDTGELVNYANDYLIGAWLYIWSATTNADQERRVSDNTQTTGVVEFPALTLPTGTVKYEMHRGWRVKDYNDAINVAIRSIADYGKANIAKAVDTSLELTADGTSSSYLYTLPAGFRYIHRILYESSTDGIYDHEVPKGAWKDSIEKLTAANTTQDATWQIRIDRRYWEPIDGRQLRILGGGEQDELSADTDTVSENVANYVVNFAAYHMLSMARGGLGSDAKANADRAREFASLAAEAKMNMKHFTPPGAIVVPR